MFKIDTNPTNYIITTLNTAGLYSKIAANEIDDISSGFFRERHEVPNQVDILKRMKY